MKNFIAIGLIFVSILIVGAGTLFVSPYYFYSKILKNDFYSEWYALTNLKDKHLHAKGALEIPESTIGNGDLWKKFHILDVLVPLPVRNPFFYASPVLQYFPDSKRTEIGIKIYDGNEREISKLYFMQNKLFPSDLNGQKFFQLPLVKKHIKSIPQQKIWQDLFIKKLNNWNIPFAEMAYNLYLLHLRTKLLPDNYKSFGLVKETNTAVIELESKNKDYITELLLTKTRGVIYSFVLISEINNEESQTLRQKFLRETQFQGGSIHLSKIIYREFKGLNYSQQIDQEGMLYLLSAWTHNTSNQDYIREMIAYLERGERTQRQLEALYKYAYSRYGQTFSTKGVEGLQLSDSLDFQRKLELEIKADEEALKNKKVIVEEKKLTKEEEMQLLLKKAKRDKKKMNKNRMIID
jgi:hypothetical protein